MIFCYKFRTFAEFWNFCLAKYRGRLIYGYSKTCIFLAKKQGVDLYTDSTYTPENTVRCLLYGFVDYSSFEKVIESWRSVQLLMDLELTNHSL